MSSTVNKTKDNVITTSPPADHHLAAILTSKGSVPKITYRPTPKPGPSELLIAVKSIALNPIDYYQRDYGFAIATYPAISGFDIAGTVLSTGSSMPSDAPKPGTRVAAFAPSFSKQGAPDYGGFQTRVLVPAANAVPLPQSMSFNEASLLPMGVVTVWGAWYSIGLPYDTAYTAADKQGMLVWGGASSIGSAAVQIAKSMGFRVYVTASEKHHSYLKTLGASEVFDYHDADVVERIVKSAKADGVKLQTGFDAVAVRLQSCLDILKEFVPAKLATARPLSEDSPKADGVDLKFMAAPTDENERNRFSHFIFETWLKPKLAAGEFVPSPRVKVVGGGLEGLNAGLDELKAGVSGVKLVLEV